MQAVLQIDTYALQNLAWRGADGTVHSVSELGGHSHLRGASAPRLQNLQLDLQSLAAANNFNGGMNINLSNLQMVDTEPYVPVQLQNLEATKEPAAQDAEAVDPESLAFGTTEYVLITMWALFTAGVFSLLYKITKEADEELHQTSKPKCQHAKTDAMDIRYAETEEDITRFEQML